MTIPEELREIARAGNFDWHGYDYENVVNAACEYGPEVLDEILRIVEEKGGDVKRLAWEIDDDGYTAMYLYAAKDSKIRAVFEKHGVVATEEPRRYAPYPNKDSYDRYMQKEIREALEKTARELHGDRMRPDGAARRIVHAANVSSMLLNWGIDDDSFRYFSTVSWCLGLREDIADEETLGNIEERIRTLLGCVSCRNLGGVAETAIGALRLLSPAGSESADGSEHVRRVAGHAGAFELAMAIADRLCLVREWLERNEIRKARAAYDEGNPLFDAGKTMQDSHFADSDVKRILAEIDVVREELDAAERTVATAPVVAAPGDDPPPCKPENNEMKGE